MIRVSDGATPYHAINSASNASVTTKSTIAVATAAPGMINRGKYTFESRFELPIRLDDASSSAVEKNCHGNTAANTRIGSGTVAAGAPTRRRNATNTAIVSAGRSRTHVTPIAVCL